MNRQRFLHRAPEGEGSERSRQLALALAEKCDPDLLVALDRHIAALQEFGGQLYLAAARDKFAVVDGDVIEVAHNEPAGTFQTWGYIIHYGHKAQIKGQPVEPDTAWGAAAPPDELTLEENGDKPELVTVPDDKEDHAESSDD